MEQGLVLLRLFGRQATQQKGCGQFLDFCLNAAPLLRGGACGQCLERRGKTGDFGGFLRFKLQTALGFLCGERFTLLPQGSAVRLDLLQPLGKGRLHFRKCGAVQAAQAGRTDTLLLQIL